MPEPTEKNKLKGGSVILKVLAIGFLILILLIPGVLILGVINERQTTRAGAEAEVSASWGFDQTVGGPVLTVPYQRQWKDTTGRVHTYIREAHFLPEELRIVGEMKPEVRYRGIYQVVLYSADLQITATFPKPSFKTWNIAPEDVLWDKAYLTIGITDTRGITEEVRLEWDKRTRLVEPGVIDQNVFKSGVSLRLEDMMDSAKALHECFFKLSLNGSGNLHFIPAGKATRVSLHSRWSDPSFTGSFLPGKRRVGGDGFSAEWKVFDLNRNFPQQWLGEAQTVQGSAFGVQLIKPVDEYQKTTRAAKYAILFIALTFLAFFLVEIMNQLRVHPVQYLLVGFAIVLFYLLLISLTEHVAFGLSYLAASAGVVLVITLYTLAIVRNLRITALIGSLMALLYGYLYVLLQLEDYALLLGSVGLFAILTVVMYLTRRIDWYSLEPRPAKKPTKPQTVLETPNLAQNPQSGDVEGSA